MTRAEDSTQIARIIIDQHQLCIYY